MHSRRARPTLRLIKEDLTGGWSSPEAPRALTQGMTAELHPLWELNHPLIQKAAECFNENAADDNPVGLIRSSNLPLYEIKVGQWRGGVHSDPTTGVHWLVAGGLAKGEHEDHDDFYEIIKRSDVSDWLPTTEDKKLLARETRARLFLEFELMVQEKVLQALSTVHRGVVIDEDVIDSLDDDVAWGSLRASQFDVLHPVTPHDVIATVSVGVTAWRGAETRHTDDLEVEISESRFGREDPALMWRAKMRILNSLRPHFQDWDRTGEFSLEGTPGAWTDRMNELTLLVQRRELAESIEGQVSHYVHKRNAADSSVDGSLIRGLCGVFFVPYQDFATIEPCPACQEEWLALKP